jgi:hypothetical protein
LERKGKERNCFAFLVFLSRSFSFIFYHFPSSFFHIHKRKHIHQPWNSINMRFTAVALLTAALAGLSSAFVPTPVGANPSGNPIVAPGLNEQVEKGKPYTIRWQPTTPTTGTVTLLLLRGPSENVVPLYPIVENVLNTGSYVWTPKTDLENDVARYGIQLIVDATGQYQYTSQFGITGATKPVVEKPVVEKPVESPTKPSALPVTKGYGAPVESHAVEYPSASSGTAVPPSVSHSPSKAPYTYLTSKMTVTTCLYPTASGKPTTYVVPSASSYQYPPPPAASVPSNSYPAGPAPTGPAPTGPAPTGTVPTGATPPPAATSPIATGAAGKKMVSVGAFVVSAFVIAFAF